MPLLCAIPTLSGGPCRLGSKSHPVAAAAEERTGGNLQDIFAMPGDDASLDPVAVAERVLGRRDRLHELDADLHALLLDTECGDFRVPARLDHDTRPRKGRFATPLLDGDFGVGRDADGVAGEQFDLRFEIGRVTHFHDLRASGEYARIFLEYIEHVARRGEDLKRLGSPAGLCTCRSAACA